MTDLGLKPETVGGANTYISFADPDGNPIYVGDWDPELNEEDESHHVVGETTP